MDTNQNEIALALSKAIVNIPTIGKTASVDYSTKEGRKIKYSFAPLSEINKAITKPLADQGLVISHQVRNNELISRLIHSSGQYFENVFQLGSYGLSNIKDFGSEITYKKRYAIDALLNLSSEDDNDAERIEEPKKSHPNYPTANSKTGEIKVKAEIITAVEGVIDTSVLPRIKDRFNLAKDKLKFLDAAQAKLEKENQDAADYQAALDWIIERRNEILKSKSNEDLDNGK